MDARSLQCIEDLRSCLELDPRVLELEKLEKELQSDPELFSLSQKMKEAEADYIQKKLSFGEEDPETQKAQKEFASIKEKLFSSPKASAYISAYSEIRLLYKQIDEILFGPFRFEAPCRRNHDPR